MPIDELNKMMRTYLEESFLNEFCEEASKALSFSAKESARKKKEAIDVISANRSIFDSDSWDVKSCKEAAEKMIQAVEASIDPIEIHMHGHLQEASVLHRSIILAELIKIKLLQKSMQSSRRNMII